MEKRLDSADKCSGGCCVKRNAQIEQAIERIRWEMHQASDRYGLSSILVLEKSRELDALLNQYHQSCGWLHKQK
ncbi:Spo0E family sporulation regulatory protein-aspartic acid phosphatase [Paenibacillus sp. D51F]